MSRPRLSHSRWKRFDDCPWAYREVFESDRPAQGNTRCGGCGEWASEMHVHDATCYGDYGEPVCGEREHDDEKCQAIMDRADQRGEEYYV